MTKVGTTKCLLITVIVLCSIYWFERLSLGSPEGSGSWQVQAESPDQKLTTTISDQRQGSPETYNQRQFLAEHISSPLLPDGYTAAFPRHVWQTSSEAGRVKYSKNSQTWEDMKGFDYHWLSDEEADDFVHQTFSKSRPSLVEFWNDLSAGIKHSTIQQNSSSGNQSMPLQVDSTASSAIVLRADLLRYMIMFVKGGVYADIDTSALVHADRWIPEQLGSQVINAIIGIEYDDTTYRMFVRPISFCQWTLMSKPNHMIFDRAISRVKSNLEFLARRQKVKSLSQLKLDKVEVLEATGPGMISDVVLEAIQDQLPDKNVSWSTFHDQKEGKLFGDILILPINAFAANQKHSHAGDPHYGEKLVQHHFGRSWYRPTNTREASGGVS